MNIGDLVVNLSMNSLSFHKGIATAQSSLKSFASSTVSAIAPVTAALGGMWSVASSVSGYKSLLQSQNKLAAAVNATGGAAGLTAQEMISLGESLQSVTNFEDETTNAAMAMLTSFKNIKGDQFKETIRAAMDMSAIMGGDLSSNAVLLGKALNDPESGLAKLAKAGVQFTAQQESTIKAMQATGNMAGAQSVILKQLESTFGGAAEAMADPWKQLQFALGDVGDIIGSVVLPSVNALVGGVSGLLTTVGTGTEWFKTFGIETAVVLSNMGGMITLIASQWELFFVKLGLDASHFFTDAVPTYIDWFARNFTNILTTLAANGLTLFENLGTNIGKAWTAVLDFFKGNPLKFDFTDLRKGFVNTIEDIPDVPKRLTTEFEKSLERDIASITEHLGEEMTKTRENLTKQLASPMKTQSVEFGLEDSQKGLSGKSTETKGPEALTQGSAAALSAIYGASRNQTQEKQLKVAEQTLAESRRQTAKLDMIASREPDVIGVAIG